jgi:hypothetical protein
MTGFRHDDPSCRHSMAVLYHDEPALQPTSQPMFYHPGHRGRRLPGPDHDYTLITTQVIPTPADDQLLSVSGDDAADRRAGVYRSQSLNE